MIDAYEIGIQLLLQDDVSAGLAVINRGLAEVDRAIAATSSSLMGLVGETERTMKAIAVAAGGRLLQTGAAEPKSVISSGDATRPSAKEGARVEKADFAEVTKGREGDVPVSPPKAVAVEDRQPSQLSPPPSVVARNGNASAPISPITREPGFLPQRRSEPVANFTGTPIIPVANTASANSDAPRRLSGRDATVADVETRQKPLAHSSKMAVTATIGKARTASSPAADKHRVGEQMTNRLSAERDRASAPWPNHDQAAPQPQIIRSAERATAPQSQGRERADGGGGVVMLDGRLVGQWLSEHMGREASRPPGGTSFFDARQTPAWNVSGAL